MTNQLTADGQPVLRLRSPEDLLAALPYILGFHPSDSLVAVGFAGPRSRLRFTVRVDLPEAGDTEQVTAVAAQVAAMLERQRAGTAMLIAYGPPERAEKLAGCAQQRLGELGIPVHEMLRVEGDRYWSLSCDDPRCCPPEGKPYDTGSSGVAAQATFAGLVALPDRETLERSVAPVGGMARVAMRQATERAEARVDDWAAEENGAEALRRRMINEGRALLHDVLDRHQPAVGDGAAGDERPGLTGDEVALLGLLLLLDPIRDEAWVLIDEERRAAHLALWTEVLRRVDPVHAAAPACLLAFTAWQSGNGALAWVAVDRALKADPDCSMAHLIGSALARGTPPVPWPDMNIADVRRMYDRPDLPVDPRRPAPGQADAARTAPDRLPVRRQVRKRRPNRRPGPRRGRPRSRRRR